MKSNKRLASWVIRAGMVFAGLGAMFWATMVFPVFWADSNIYVLATRILSGDYPKAAVEAVDDSKWVKREGWLVRPATASKFVLASQLRTENALTSGNGLVIDESFRSLRRIVYQALESSPSEGFLWLVLFWLENNQSGFDQKNVSHLRASYQMAPNESWIALRRNPIALKLVSALPSDLNDEISREFAGLVRARFFNAAAQTLAGVSGTVRQSLLNGLAEVSEPERRALAKFLQSRQIEDFSIPRIDLSSKRLWN